MNRNLCTNHKPMWCNCKSMTSVTLSNLFVSKALFRCYVSLISSTQSNCSSNTGLDCSTKAKVLRTHAQCTTMWMWAIISKGQKLSQWYFCRGKCLRKYLGPSDFCSTDFSWVSQKMSRLFPRHRELPRQYSRWFVFAAAFAGANNLLGQLLGQIYWDNTDLNIAP